MQNVTFCSGTYYLTDVNSDGVVKFGNSSFTAICNSTIIVGNNSGYGFYSSYNRTTVQGCTVANYSIGLYLSGSRNSTLANNTVANTTNYGIYLLSTWTSNISLNTFNTNMNLGIMLEQGSNNTLISNGFYNNSGTAISLYLNSNNNNMTKNNITNSTNYGIGLSTNSNNNTFTNNTLQVDTGGIDITASTGNLFYYNNISGTAGYYARSTVSGNYFNITVGGKARGNFWDDVASLHIYDNNGDGFGDTGDQYPYSSAFSSKVSAYVSDWGPITNKTCVDNDGDNYGQPGTNLTACQYSQYGDCNDANASVFPPRDDLNITANTWLCNGTFYLNNSVSTNGIVNFKAGSITLTCNKTVIIGNNTGFGIYSKDYNQVSIIGCNMSNYTAGLYFNNSNSSTIRNNTLVNNTYGIYIVNATSNTFYYNNIRNSTVYHAYTDTAGNNFNTTSLGTTYGNYWGGVEQLKIYDTNSNGYGDAGIQYPYSNAKGGFVSANIADYGPITTRNDYLIQPPYPFAPLDMATVTDSRNPNYGWSNSEHTLSDSVTYQIQVDDDINFGSPSVDVAGIGETPLETYYWTASTLQFFTTYYWHVRANDTYYTSDWSTASQFSILPTVSCTQPTAEIEFGQMCIFPNQTECDLYGYGSHINDTIDNHPPPYISENNGNLKLSGKIYSDSLWTSRSIPTGPSKFYQFMLAAKEPGSYDWALDSGWENMTFTLPSAKLAYYGFKWENATDEYNLHIRLEVPDDEPAGTKYSTTAIWCEQNESYY
jgi:parallel beta-helix repeat protein